MLLVMAPSQMYSRRLQNVNKCAGWLGGLVHVNRACRPAMVVRTNGSAVFSPLDHRDQPANLQGRTFIVPATSYTHETISTHSAGHIDSLDVKLTLELCASRSMSLTCFVQQLCVTLQTALACYRLQAQECGSVDGVLDGNKSNSTLSSRRISERSRMVCIFVKYISTRRSLR